MHTQAYLLSAIYTISERADSLSSKTVLSIQELLTSILLFTPTMAMQYCASASVPLLLACMLKLKTGLCLGLCDVLVGSDGEASNFTLSSSSSSSSAASSDGDGASVDAASGEREAMLAQKEVRSLMIGNHPLAVPSLEFLLWWSFVSWFIMHSLCLLYVRHSAKQRSLDAENTESEGEADESEMVNFTKKNR